MFNADCHVRVVYLIMCKPTTLLVWLGGRVVRMLDQQVTSSNPGLSAMECNTGQVVNKHVPPSPSSIIWYQPMSGDALRWECNRRSGFALAMRHRQFSGITTYGLMALEREMSTLPIPSRSTAQFTLLPYCMLCCMFCYTTRPPSIIRSCARACLWRWTIDAVAVVFVWALLQLLYMSTPPLVAGINSYATS